MPYNSNEAERNFRLILLLWGCSFLITLISYAEDSILYFQRKHEFVKVVDWLKEHSPSSLKRKQAFYDAGVMSLEQLCMLTEDEFQFLSEEQFFWEGKTVRNDLKALKREMIMKFWLKDIQAEDIFEKLLHFGFNSLQALVSHLQDDQIAAMLNNDKHKIAKFLKKLVDLKSQSGAQNFDEYPIEDSATMLRQSLKMVWRITRYLAKSIFWLMTIAAIVIAALLWVICHFLEVVVIALGQALSTEFQRFLGRLRNGTPATNTPVIHPRRPLTMPQTTPNVSAGVGFLQSIINFFTRGRNRNSASEPTLPYNPSKTVLTFSWEDENAVVGEMRCVTVQLYSNFFKRCLCKDVRNPSAMILCDTDVIPCITEENGPDSFVIKFTPTLAANYEISFYANGCCAKTVTKKFLPGEIDPSKTTVKIASTTIVLMQGMPAFISLAECDKYGNALKSSEESLARYKFSVNEIKGNCDEVNPELAFTEAGGNYVFLMTFNRTGCYKSTITYENETLSNSALTFIVLTDKEWDKMTSIAKDPSWNTYFEAYSVPGPGVFKRKKVYIYLTPKQLLVKEYYMKIIPKRTKAMRLRSTLKLLILPEVDPGTGYPLMSVMETGRTPLKFFCKDRNILIASFTQLMLRKTGGTDAFEHKRQHLYAELRKIYARKATIKQSLQIKRENLLKESIDATKSLSNLDWGKQLTIEFVGEEGLDFGGVRREWFQLLCDSLFKPENHLFHKSGKDDAQSLIHPNPFRPASHKKLDLYEFAGKIVGKLLIECAYDRQQYVKARFSRAFLAQIIGLRVSWKIFESDDKELFKTKIDYILNNDPEDLELTFTEDIYDDDQTFIKTIELKSNGSRINVTNENKLEYLQLVAEYRMVKSVRDEINAFTKGLNAIIPENLLTLFDETELEFLICGTDEILPMDLKEHHTKCLGGGNSFEMALLWFWEIILGFNQEEMARLLQFTTGSSQLPPGGFKELAPKFQLNSFPGRDILPTAHTCFNMLCLPEYSSKKEFKKLLLLAINEGSEGFGLA